MGPELIAAIEAAGPALAVAGGGSALSMLGQQDAADQRRSVINRQMERDNTATGKAIDMVQQEGKNYGMDQRVQGLQQQQQKSFDQTQADLNGAGGASIGTAGGAGAVSDDFLKSKAARAIDEGTRLTAVAQEAAKTRAPGMLGNEDALRKANLAGGLDSLWGSTGNMARANGLDAESVQEPIYGQLGKIASSIGTGMAAGQLGKALGPYAGASTDMTAANYTNSFDRMNPTSGIQFGLRR